MASGVDLLRLLEPAVRPGGLPAPARAATEPFEARSFESLLAEAQASSSSGQPGPAAADTCDADAAPKARSVNDHLLAGLAGVDRIENSTLLQVVSAAAQALQANGNGNAKPQAAPS